MFQKNSSFIENAVGRTERRVRGSLDYLHGNLSQLRRTAMDAGQRAALQGVEQATSEILLVMERLRDLVSGSTDQPAQYFRFDLERTLDWVRRQFKGPMESEGLAFRLEVGPDTPTLVQGDAQRLRSVLVCLLDNALQFCPGGTVSLNVNRKDPDQDLICFEVHDSGPGMTAELRRAVFAGDLCQESAPSLAIVQSWLQSMDSRLELGESSEGAHFTFELRLREEQGPHVSHTRSSLIGKRVLIVDQSLASRKLLERSLHHVGACCVSCSGLDEALSFLQSGELPDTIILDSELGGTRPEEAANAILNLSDVPLILLVPMAVRGDGARFKEMGCRAYLVKPLHQEQILEALSAALAVGKIQPFITTHSLEEATKLSIRVLLMAEEGLLSRQAEHLLRQAGHEVTRLRANREALQALPTDSSFDLLLLDSAGCRSEFLAELNRWRSSLPRIGLVSPDDTLSSRLELDEVLYIPLRTWELSQVVLRWAGRELQRTSSNLTPVEVPAIRLGELNEATDGDEELQVEMIETFCQDLEASFQSFDDALSRGDLSGVSAEAHALKGSAPYFGADKLTELADTLQRVAKAGDAGATTAVLDRCRDEYQRILNFFEAMRG